MSAVTVIYALLFYAATAILVFGVLRKIAIYARTPQPLKIPTTPAPTTRLGMVAGLLGLWSRRVLVDRVRYISGPSDHLMLALLVAIGGSGIAMRYLAHTDIVALKAFFLGLMAFSWHPSPKNPPLRGA